MLQSALACYARLAVFLLVIILITGCEQRPASNKKQAAPKDGPALKIGLIPEQDVFAQKKRYAPLLAYLSEQVGMRLESSILPRYMNIIDNFKQQNLDGAFFGSFTGALAIEKLGVEPLARPQYVNGASTYYGMVFVRKGSDIRTAEDMRGKRMVFVDKATTAGYLLPMSYFRSLGINNFGDWFGEFYFSGTHEGAINDVLNGFADIGAAKNTVFYRMAEEDNRVSRELEILATSPHVPANGLSVRGDLPQTAKQLLKKSLLTMHEDSRGQDILQQMGIERFIETTVDDYQPVFDYAASIGLDLQTYDYQND